MASEKFGNRIFELLELLELLQKKENKKQLINKII